MIKSLIRWRVMKGRKSSFSRLFAVVLVVLSDFELLQQRSSVADHRQEPSAACRPCVGLGPASPCPAAYGRAPALPHAPSLLFALSLSFFPSPTQKEANSPLPPPSEKSIPATTPLFDSTHHFTSSSTMMPSRSPTYRRHPSSQGKGPFGPRRRRYHGCHGCCRARARAWFASPPALHPSHSMVALDRCGLRGLPPASAAIAGP